MAASHVALHGSGIKSQKGAADREGRFSFSVEKEGGYWLWLAGVHHKTLLIPILADGNQKMIDVTVRLATADYVVPLEKVYVIGDFNKFSTKSGSIEMQKQSDGTFAATVESQSDTLRYQLSGVQTGDFPICGTQADSFEPNKENPLIADHSFLFDSVIKTGGKPVRIVFDPKKLPRSQADADIRFGEGNTTAAKIVLVDRELRKRADRYQQAAKAYVAAGKDPSKFQYDFSDELHAHEQQIENEHDPLVKQYLMLRYFNFPTSDTNSALAQRVFKEIPPAALVWSMLWAGPVNVLNAVSKAANAPEAEEMYRQQVLATHPDADVRAAFLYSALRKAHSRGEADKVGRYYTHLMDEFSTTQYARMAKEIAPNRNVMKGKPVPDFKLISLDDSSEITPEKLKGSVYLIDFWAVWCGPCVGEMKFLHNAYEKYRATGFKILSVSIDDTAEDVAKFRQSKWPMPWINARVEDGFGGNVATSFEVLGLPKPILVGRDGQIIASEGELRGEKLLETLARVIGEIRGIK
jgi:thiol-disulfide isomerase/thioredoxin